MRRWAGVIPPAAYPGDFLWLSLNKIQFFSAMQMQLPSGCLCNKQRVPSGPRYIWRTRRESETFTSEWLKLSSPCPHPAGERGEELYSSCHPTGVGRPGQQLKVGNAPLGAQGLHGDPGKYHSTSSSVQGHIYHLNMTACSELRNLLVTRRFAKGRRIDCTRISLHYLAALLSPSAADGALRISCLMQLFPIS